mmetsp:Transcript_12861/g.30859  ORF Transcript_12861/g.30859 Transcript_12861/m.30859 type:complete len:432 (+) Transcript_12861:37-1332(+)
MGESPTSPSRRRATLAQVQEPKIQDQETLASSLAHVLADTRSDIQYVSVYGTHGPGMYTRGRLSPVEEGLGHDCLPSKCTKPGAPPSHASFAVRLSRGLIFGVMEGHGSSGGQIANFAANNVARQLLMHFDVLSELMANETASSVEQVKQMVVKIFESAHAAVVASDDAQVNLTTKKWFVPTPDDKAAFIDATSSGCCAIVGIVVNDQMVLANCGDAAAKLLIPSSSDPLRVRYNDAAPLPKPLRTRCSIATINTQHIASNREESDRISNLGGVCFQLSGDPCLRVFVAGRVFPGLTVSRSLGDIVAKEIGVIPTPDVYWVKLSNLEAGATLVIATDAVWKYLSDGQGCDVVRDQGKHGAKSGAAHLNKLAAGKWDANNDGFMGDLSTFVFWVPQWLQEIEHPSQDIVNRRSKSSNPQCAVKNIVWTRTIE